jgi:hypothetical protein
MNLFVLFGDGAITRKKKMTETLRKCLKNARKMTSAMCMEQRAVITRTFYVQLVKTPTEKKNDGGIREILDSVKIIGV